MNLRLLSAVWMFLVVSAGVSAQNLAANPGFEIGPPPGPGIAEAWMPYSLEGPPPEYFLMSEPWAVHSGAKSQMWFSPVPTRSGIGQIITETAPGEVYTASVFIGDPDPAGPFGPTRFRIGIEPSGSGPGSPGAVWSAWFPVTSAWQEIGVQAEALGPQISLFLESSNVTTGGPPQYQFPYPHSRAIVDDVVVVKLQPCSLITNVPDANQPPNNPLGYPHVNGYCGPMSAVNITEYWDVVMGVAVAANVNAGLGTQNAAPYIGHWMDTNNFVAGCPFRANGSVLPAGIGTYVADLTPGIAQFARWDANNTFGCTPPPNLPAGKQGHPWTVLTRHNRMQNAGPGAGTAWADIMAEIDAGRPLVVSWSYWNPQATGVTDANGVTYYLWGNPVNGSQDPNPGEDWNYPYDPEENPQGPTTIGHDTTAVGYCANHDPDGAGPLPQTNWVIVHDNWPTTARDVAIPLRHQQLGWSPWVANTFVRLVGPQTGTLNVAAGPKNPGNHWWWSGASPNEMAQLRLTAGAVEAVQINAVTLVAAGTGDDKNDVLGVDLVDDANSNGVADQGEATVASGTYPADNGTLTIQIAGPTYVVPANQSRDMLVVYRMNNAAPVGNTYSFQVSNIYAAGDTTFLPINPAGLPQASATKTVASILVEPCPRIGYWRTQPDGTYAIIQGCSPVVSAGNGRFAGRIYVQEEDRSAGIQVYFGNEPVPTIPEGVRIELAAVIDTIDGERVLVQPNILGYSTAELPEPLFVNNRAVGGASTLYDPGVVGGFGLTNEGLLVRTAGQVVALGTDFFAIDDGSAGPGRPPLKISLSGLAAGNTVPIPPVGLYVAVTGISSAQPYAGGYEAVIRPRAMTDIAAVSSPYSIVNVEQIIRDRIIHAAGEMATFTVRLVKDSLDPFEGNLVVKVRDDGTDTETLSTTRSFSMGAGETTHDEVFVAAMPHDAVWDIGAWVLDLPGYVESSGQSEYGVRPDVPGVPEDILTYQPTWLSPTALLAQIETSEVVMLEMGPRSFELDVVPNDLMLSEQVRAENPEIRLFKGKIVGNEESEVRLTFDGYSVSGYVMASPDDMQVIVPLADYVPGAGPTDYITYNSAAMRHPGFGEDSEEGLGSAEILSTTEPAVDVTLQAPTVRTLLRLNVYADNGVSPLDHINDIEGTLSHEANVRIYVNSLNRNLNTNNYSAPSNCGTGNPSALTSFINDANVTLNGADKAILFSNNGNLNYGGTAGCGSRPGNYCWLRHSGSSWTVRLTGCHELGHNFGLVHDNGVTRTETRGWWIFKYTVNYYGIMNSAQQSNEDDTYNTRSMQQRATAQTNAGNQCPRRSARWTGNELGNNNIRLRDWEVQYTNNPARGDPMVLGWLFYNSSGGVTSLSNIFVGCRDPNNTNRDFGHIGAVNIGGRSYFSYGYIGWTGTSGRPAGNWHFWPAYSYNCGGTCYGPYKWHEAVINFR